MLQHLINLNDDGLFKEIELFTDLYYSGSYGNIVSPKNVWHNGSTFITGYKSSATNNSPVILQYKNGEVFYAEVGVIDNFDPLEHAHPALLVLDGYVHVFQVNGHGQDIKIWKINNPEDVRDGFTLIFTIPGKFGYCNPRLLSDGRVIILSRITNDTVDVNYSQIFTINNIPGDLTSWTNIRTTNVDYGASKNRHYPSALLQYGVNQWHYIGISLRNENPGSIETYFGQAIMKTKDFTTFYNKDETFSKNIDVNGVLTPTELESHFMIIGSHSEVENYVLPKWSIVINDTVYGRCIRNGYIEFYKIDLAGNLTFYPCAIPDIDLTENFSYKLEINYNGNNLIIKVGGVLYGCDFNFENITFLEQYIFEGEENKALSALLPYNLNEITGKYMFGGGITPGVFPYFITDDKFLI